MKKIISTMSFIGMLALASTASAVISNGTNGSITLSDAVAGRPGITAIAISERSFVTYSGLAGAGGYATNGTCPSGSVMAVASASSAADPQIALYFAVRDSNDPDCVPDNNVYQKSAAGTAPTAALVDAEITVDYGNSASYSIRGAAAGS